MGNRLAQFGHNQSQATLALGQAESPFHFHTLTFVQKILRLVSDFVLLRPAQRRTGELDTVLLTESQILPVPVDLIRQNPAGVVSLPFPELLCHRRQVSRFVVGVKGEALQSGPAVYHTDVQLRAEFYGLSRLPSNNGAQERLTDADDPVWNRVAAVVVHVPRRSEGRLFSALPFFTTVSEPLLCRSARASRKRMYA